MPTVTPPSDHRRIRTGLKALAKLDRRAIKAAVQLEKFAGVEFPPGVSDLLQWYTFDVAGLQFSGRMTQKQAEYLNNHNTGTLADFANALSDVLVSLEHAAVQSLKNLSQGLNAVDTQVAALATASDPVVLAGGEVDPPPLGTCHYDTDRDAYDVTEDFCEGVLLGTSWEPNDTVIEPAEDNGKPKKARTKRRR
ncbi:MAG TPA: hypothetical protein VFA18_15880 [Gemmataceae bacterium]|nr:hypothetical protein [Gemmataceae bacterium]